VRPILFQPLSSPSPALRDFAFRSAEQSDWEFRSNDLGYDRIDRDNGIIYGVCVIQRGVTAEGHGLVVDDRCVTQLHSKAASLEKVPVKMNHKTGIENMVGNLQNFRVEGDKLRADLYLLSEHEKFNFLLQAAETQPTTFGMSVAFRGLPEIRGLQRFARCEKLKAVDIVADPAACPDGLFSASDAPPVDTLFAGMPADGHFFESGSEPSNGEIATALNHIGGFLHEFTAQMRERDEALQHRFDEIDEVLYEDPEGEGVDGADDGADGEFVPIQAVSPEALDEAGYAAYYQEGGEVPAGAFQEQEDPRLVELQAQVQQLTDYIRSNEFSAYQGAQETMMDSLSARMAAVLERAEQAEAERDAAFAAMEAGDLALSVNPEDGESRFVSRRQARNAFRSELEEIAFSEWTARGGNESDLTIHDVMREVGTPEMWAEHLNVN